LENGAEIFIIIRPVDVRRSLETTQFWNLVMLSRMDKHTLMDEIINLQKKLNANPTCSCYEIQGKFINV